MSKKKIIIIGGGAAGLMAAGIAADLGADVTILEKKERPGRKILISGKGRCNITNIAQIKDFIARFGTNGKFLRQAFARFFTDELIELLNELGVATVVERGGRVFPISNEAREIVDALAGWAKAKQVKIITNTPVNNILVENGRVVGVKTETEYYADAVIIATGGKSYPATGSTGDGYHFAKSAGHTIIDPRPALVPLETSGTIAQRLQGLSLKNVSARLFVEGKKRSDEFGEMLFTHFGLSGPIILTLSGTAVDALLEHQSVMLSIDLKPALDEQKLDKRLLRDFTEHSNQQFQNVLKGLLPQRLIEVCVDQTRIDPDKPAHQITSDERKRLRVWLKDFRFDITGHRGFKESIITAGGISLKEINPRTMESTLVSGLFFAGEVLDVAGDTGGYNLQAAFSTGWLAGMSAAQ